jgi:hypothetical protein
LPKGRAKLHQGCSCGKLTKLYQSKISKLYLKIIDKYKYVKIMRPKPLKKIFIRNNSNGFYGDTGDGMSVAFLISIFCMAGSNKIVMSRSVLSVQGQPL